MDAAGDKDAFFQLIMDERKFEFGGEGLRWRDLVRWNKYAEVIRDVFYKYYYGALAAAGDDAIFEEMFGHEFSSVYPQTLLYRKITSNDYTYKDFGWIPNTSLPWLDIGNPLTQIGAGQPKPAIKENGTWVRPEGAENWENPVDFMLKLATGDATPDTKTCYSLRGYIQGDEYGNTPVPDLAETPAEQLPVVRYILPIPQSVISRSQGAYSNAYGYR